MVSRSTRVRTTSPPLLTALAVVPGRAVVRLTGDADVSTAPVIADVLADASATGMPLGIVDLAAVRFWDVSGLHELAACTASLAADGRQCRLVGANAATRRLIALADFTGVLQLDGPMPVPARRVDPAPYAGTQARQRARRRRFWSVRWRRQTGASEGRSHVDPHPLIQAVAARRWR